MKRGQSFQVLQSLQGQGGHGEWRWLESRSTGQEEIVTEIKERVLVDLTGGVGEDFAELPSDGDVNDNLVNYSEKE